MKKYIVESTGISHFLFLLKQKGTRLCGRADDEAPTLRSHVDCSRKKFSKLQVAQEMTVNGNRQSVRSASFDSLFFFYVKYNNK